MGTNDSTQLLPRDQENGKTRVTNVNNVVVLTKYECECIYDMIENDTPLKPITIMHKELAENEEVETNPYEQLVLNNDLGTKEIVDESSIESWSVLTTNPSYPDTNAGQEKNISTQTDSGIRMDISDEMVMFEINTNIDDSYLDQFLEIKSTINPTRYFNDDRDISTTYLGTPTRITKSDRFMKEHSLKLTWNSRCQGQLKDGTKLNILFDTGATKCYMSMKFYKSSKLLQEIPKFSCNCRKIRVGNGETIEVSFAIPVVVQIQEHLFELFALVTDMHPDLQLVWGIKNMYETEGVINTRNSTYLFKNRSLPIFLAEQRTIPPNSTKAMTVICPFVLNITGTAIFKVYDQYKWTTLCGKFINNTIQITITNPRPEPLTIDRKFAIGILDLRSMGFYKANAEDIENKLAQKYDFTCLYKLCQEFNNQITQTQQQREKSSKEDPYPWLEPDDWRRNKTDKEILDATIDLTKSKISNKEKKRVMQTIYKHKSAFSLRDEIGECPNIKVNIDVLDESPFFVRPFNISEEDKPFMDWQMERLVHLGILSKKSTSHSSPVMLISRKVTKDKRAVTDFRLLNARIVRKNCTTPLMRDIFNTLGRSEIDYMSCIDLKDAYHSLRLTEKAKEYCGIVPYFGAPCYRYERMPMGLSISPAKWIEYVNILLENLKYRQQYIAIMDDLLLYSKKEEHFTMFEELLKAIEKFGLKISPKKCQLFMTELLYMGNTFKINQGKVTITALKSRCEAIQKFPPPKNMKGCKRFCGVVNYLSMFCPNIQKILKPIYDLTRKGKPFNWGKEQEEAFIEIKQKLLSPPILHLPTKEGRFILYTDTSRTHAGSALWQVQEGQPKLIGYASKSLPTACTNYSVTELEMKGLITGILTWTYIIGRKEFDCAVDHQAVIYIMKSKNEPPSKRIMRFLEELGKYTFNLYYMKGKDMILSDFLSRGDIPDEESPHELIPVTYSIQDLWTDKLNSLGERITRSKAKTMGIEIGKVHGVDKVVDPDLKPEHQQRSNKDRSKQLRDKQDISKGKTPKQLINQHSTSSQVTKQNLVNRSVKWLTKRPINRPIKTNYPIKHRVQKPEHPSSTEEEIGQTPHYQELPHKQIDLDQETYEADIEFKRPDNKIFEHPIKLGDLIDTSQKYYKSLPRQKEIDQVLSNINHKILRQTKFTTDFRDMEAAYLQSQHFADIYKYLKQGKLPLHKGKMKQTMQQAESYIILDTLLFKISDKSEDNDPKLCIPTAKVDLILRWYHNSVLGGHQGMTKCILTIRKRFHIPELARHVRAYITGCHICQQFKKRKYNRPFEQRVNINVPSLTKFSMDLKHMPQSRKGHKFILVIICEVSNYIITAALKRATAEAVCEALVEKVFGYFGTPTQIVSDLGSEFMSSVTRYMLAQYKIRWLSVGPTNHKSLMAEHGIKSIANIIMKHLSGMGQDWHIFLPFTMLSYNIYNTPNLDNYAPIEIVLGRKVKLNPQLEITPEVEVTRTHKEYVETLRKRLKYLQENLQKFRDKRLQKLNKDRELHKFEIGQLVYMYNPAGARLQTGSQKIKCEFVGPLVIYKVISPTQFILMSLDGIIYPHLVEDTRIKPGTIKTHKGNVHTLADLKEAIKAEL